MTQKPRRFVPHKVISLLEEWNVNTLFANISYEVDELRRDIETCQLAKGKNIHCDFIQDKLIIEPGILRTNEGKPYTVRGQ